MDDTQPPELDDDTLDRIARAAGAELRRPPTASSVARVTASGRRRRTVRQVATATVAVISLGVAGVVVTQVVRSNDTNQTITSPSTVPAPPSTVTTPVTSLVSTPSDTVPSTAPPPVTTVPHPTTSIEVTSTTSEPVIEPAPIVAPVSYLDPPPELAMRPLGSLQLQEPASGGYSAAIGDLGVLVSPSSDGEEQPLLHVLGFDGEVRSFDVPSSGTAIAYGPGDVAYLTRQGDSSTDFSIEALALSGERAGSVVASTPASPLRFVELPTATFGHSDSGIIDRRFPDEIATPVATYVDIDGQPVTLDEPVVTFIEERSPGAIDWGGVVRSSNGTSWSLQTEAAPDRADSYVGNSPPAAGPAGTGVYWTWIGPDAAPDEDFGEPTMWVIAEMRPDGTATWWSLPDGWVVVASDVWGTVLAKQTGTELQLALADFDAQAPPGAECINDVLAPSMLVDGSAPGEPVVVEYSDNSQDVIWGDGLPVSVSQQLAPVFYEEGPLDFVDWVRGTRQLLSSAEREVAVVPVGDPPISLITIYVRVIGTDCVRVYTIGPGHTLDEAIDFASSFL